jgi:hypothetical protein
MVMQQPLLPGILVRVLTHIGTEDGRTGVVVSQEEAKKTITAGELALMAHHKWIPVLIDGKVITFPSNRLEIMPNG